MNTPRVCRLFLRGICFCGPFLLLLVMGRPMLAVITTGYAFGLDGTPVFDYQPHDASGIETAISSSFTTGVTAHAQSWAYSKLIGGVLTKTAGGIGWVDGTNPSELFLWSAFASGTELIVTGPSTGTLVPLQLVLPGIGTADNQRPAILPNPPAAVGDATVQGLFNHFGPAVPSFFDVFVELDASVKQETSGGPFSQSLFNGSATLHSDGQFVANGDFSTAFNVNPKVDNRASVSIENDVIGPVFMVEAGVPFQLTMNLFLTMGDPERMGNSAATVPVFSGIDTLGQTVGGGGSFVVELRLMGDGSLNEIPEPTSAVVWLVGLVVSAGCFRRRGRCR